MSEPHFWLSIALQAYKITPNDPKETFLTAIHNRSSGLGAGLQFKISDMVQKLTSMMPTNSDAIEAACDIIRAGYKEISPGLFVFPPKVTVDFVRSASLNTSRLDKVLETAAKMLSSSKASDVSVQTAASELLNYAMMLLAQLNCKPCAAVPVGRSPYISGFEQF